MRHHPFFRPTVAVGLAAALTLPVVVAPVTGVTPAAAAAHVSTASSAATPTGPSVSTVASFPTSDGTPADTATTGGPLPTSIRLSEDDASTTVLVHGLGDAQTEKARENRRMRHSDDQPTARFVTAGQEVTITVPEGAPEMSVVIGLHGAYAAYNGGASIDPRTIALQPGENVVQAPVDGMVFLRSTVVGGSAEVVVTGGRPVPSFVLGQTTNEHLRAEMARLSDAPFVTIVGERMYGDFQMGRTGSAIAAADVPARVSMWDRSVEITNATYGLSDDGTGTARKAPHRIYVAAPDAIPGAYATAGDESINFPASGAARDLFARDETGLWGFWHEIGHTYQAPNYLWSGMSEVTVNISPLHVQSVQGWPSTVDSAGHLATLERFFAKPVDERDYATSGTNELVFEHLRRGFGDHFFSRLNQEFRVMAARGETTGTSDQQKKQLFAVTAARVADRDLSEFFRQWGFPLSAETRAVMAELPPLEQPIWQNRHSSNLIREYEMTPYSVPVGEVAALDEQVVVGQRQLTSQPALVGLGDSGGDGDVRVLDHVLTTLTPGTGTVGVTAANGLGVREVFTAPVEVTPGTSLQFRGIVNRVVAALAVPTGSDELRLIPGTTYQSHPNFGHDEYVGATVRDARGRETASFSVTGYETAHPAARAFDGTRFTDGMYLTVRHEEANSRSTRWDDGTEVPRNPATVQHYRYDTGRLVPVTDIPVTSALDAVPVTEPVQLRRGTTTDTTITLETTERITALDADLVVTAPDRTTLDTEEALVTQVRLPGGDWVTTDDLQVTRTPGTDGRITTLTVTSTDGLDLPTGTRLRWSVGITVPATTHTIGTDLTWTVTGTADGRTVTARS